MLSGTGQYSHRPRALERTCARRAALASGIIEGVGVHFQTGFRLGDPHEVLPGIHSSPTLLLPARLVFPSRLFSSNCATRLAKRSEGETEESPQAPVDCQEFENFGCAREVVLLRCGPFPQREFQNFGQAVLVEAQSVDQVIR